MVVVKGEVELAFERPPDLASSCGTRLDTYNPQRRRGWASVQTWIDTGHPGTQKVPLSMVGWPCTPSTDKEHC